MIPARNDAAPLYPVLDALHMRKSRLCVQAKEALLKFYFPRHPLCCLLHAAISRSRYYEFNAIQLNQGSRIIQQKMSRIRKNDCRHVFQRMLQRALTCDFESLGSRGLMVAGLPVFPHTLRHFCKIIVLSSAGHSSDMRTFRGSESPLYFENAKSNYIPLCVLVSAWSVLAGWF